MANVICTKCGLTGISKNPFTRSIFPGDSPIAGKDSVASRCLKITEEGIFVKRYKVAMDGSGPESTERMLERLQWLLSGCTAEDLKVLACIHEWDFAPGEVSEV